MGQLAQLPFVLLRGAQIYLRMIVTAKKQVRACDLKLDPGGATVSFSVLKNNRFKGNMVIGYGCFSGHTDTVTCYPRIMKWCISERFFFGQQLRSLE